jgi:hypothetical protein
MRNVKGRGDRNHRGLNHFELPIRLPFKSMVVIVQGLNHDCIYIALGGLRVVLASELLNTRCRESGRA